MAEELRAIGDPRATSSTGMFLLPVDTSNGQCSQCGRLHEPDAPHDGNSLFYQYAFRAEHGRWPTWADALAHCDDVTRQLWRQALAENGVEVPGE